MAHLHDVFCADIKKWVLNTQREEHINFSALTRFVIRFIAVWILHEPQKQIRDPKPPYLSDLIAILSQYKFTRLEHLSGEDTVILDPEILGEVFEMLLEIGCTRKNTGSFYTPPEIVRRMVESALCRYFCTETGEPEINVGRWISIRNFPPEKSAAFLPLLKKIRIIDPACGSGTFIIMVLDVLFQIWNSLEPASPEKMISRKQLLLQNNIFGCDIQPTAVYITKLRCRFALEHKSASIQNIITADSLTYEWTQKFDIVLGNPPYVPICQIPSIYRKQLQKKYRFASARFNLFYLFIEKTSELLKKNGIAELIIPDRLLKNTQCVHLREWMLHELDLYKVISFPNSVFKSAVIDPVIIAFQNRQPHNQSILCSEWGRDPVTEIPCSFIQNSPHFQLNLNCSKAQFELLQKIRSHSVELGMVADIRDGIIQGAVADHLFLNSPKDEFSKPFLVGEDIAPYSLSFAGRWIDYRPEEMMKLERSRRKNPGLRLRNPSIFERDKILTRQTADRIIAVCDTENYYYCNTLHGTALTSDEFDPFFITGVLNSRVMIWLYRTETSECGMSFAQVKIATLRKLPIVCCTKEKQKEISEYALQIQRKSRNAENLMHKIDECLYSIYDLNANEIALVEKSGKK